MSCFLQVCTSAHKTFIFRVNLQSWPKYFGKLLCFCEILIRHKQNRYLVNLVNELPEELPNDFRLRILENQKIIGKSHKLEGDTTQRPVSPLRNQLLAITVKTYAKADIKVFISCVDLFDFFKFLLNIFSSIVGAQP